MAVAILGLWGIGSHVVIIAIIASILGLKWGFDDHVMIITGKHLWITDMISMLCYFYYLRIKYVKFNLLQHQLKLCLSFLNWKGKYLVTLSNLLIKCQKFWQIMGKTDFHLFSSTLAVLNFSHPCFCFNFLHTLTMNDVLVCLLPNHDYLYKINFSVYSKPRQSKNEPYSYKEKGTFCYIRSVKTQISILLWILESHTYMGNSIE